MDEALANFKRSGRELMDYLNGHINDLEGERQQLLNDARELENEILNLRTRRDYVEMAVVEMDSYLKPQPSTETAQSSEPSPTAEPTREEVVEAMIASYKEAAPVALTLEPVPSDAPAAPDPHHTDLRGWITASLEERGTVKVKKLAQELRASGKHNANQSNMKRLADNIGWHLRNLVASGNAKRTGPGEYVWVNANH